MLDRPSGPVGADPGDAWRLRGPRLTSLSSAAGCAAKLGMDELDGLIGRAFTTGRATQGPTSAEGPAIGIGDDGAVVVVGDAQVVATTDFFTPIVDDPWTWGCVAATNAIGDVHAMGGTPTAGLVVLGWPAGQRHDDLDDVLAGLRDGAAVDGVVIVGGHSIDSSVPFVGLAVLGSLAGPALRQDAARPGDVLVLSAPVGTGIATTAALRAPVGDSLPGGPLHQVLAAAVRVMATSNAPVARAARRHGVAAATDVTGFGLLGHLHRMALASTVDVAVDAAAVPVLPGVVALARDGVVPGGSRRNADALAVRAGVEADATTLAVLADAQTSGGLLLAVAADGVDGLVHDLGADGIDAAVIGRVTSSGSGQIAVRGHVS